MSAVERAAEYRIELTPGRVIGWRWQLIHDDYGGFPITAARGWATYRDGAAHQAKRALARRVAEPKVAETLRGDDLFRQEFR